MRVSEWLPRFVSDGFDGVELWEFHHLSADADERARLVAEAAPVAIYNSYVGFGDEEADARARSAEAIRELGAVAVKYNLGDDHARLDEYRRNLLAWAEQLPQDCRLLCECHGGTVLEKLEDAVAFFRDLDPVRFGIIVHTAGVSDGLSKWFEAFGPRIQHLHVQLRNPETDPSLPENRERMAEGFGGIRRAGFSGSASIEFTRGIGRDENPEELYRNACVDMAFCREHLSGIGRG